MRLTDDQVQWTAAVFVVAGHFLNAVGPKVYPWNIAVFAVGITLFLVWSLRTKNAAQTTVNVISLAIAAFGLVKALGNFG